MISRASAPGKIILFGEHFVVHGVGAVLAAIDRRITVSSRIVDRPVISIRSELGECETGVSRGDGGGDAGASGVIGELGPFEFIAKRMIGRFAGGTDRDGGGGVHIEIESEIPHGVGLGSSSAACVAAAASISGLFTELGRDEVCRLAIEAEKTVFARTSGADCTVCTHGGVILYGKGAGFERVGCGSGLDIVVSDSGTAHSTGEVVARVSGFMDRNPERFDELCRKEAELVDRAGAMIRSGGEDAAELGAMMRENHGYLREIGVSNEALERIVGVADQGSFGSKITGAGGGGCVVSAVGGGGGAAMPADALIDRLEKNGIRCFAAGIDCTGLETF